MKLYFSNKIFLMLFIGMLPLFSSAQITTKVVKFPTGKSSTTVNSSIKGYQIIDYVLSLTKGQELKVDLNTKNLSCYFNVMAPGQKEVAFFIGSNEGNSYKGILKESGKYTIRVYLYRNAARENKVADFSLKIAAASGKSGVADNATDAKVLGTNFNAKGEIKVISAGKETKATFGVIRLSKGNAEVYTELVSTGQQRVLLFTQGKWACKSNSCIVTSKKIGVDEWEVIVNNKEHYFIPEAVVYGG